MSDDKEIIEELLSDSFSKNIIKELGIENDEPEVQAALISRFGANVMDRVTVAILKKLPEEKHPEFGKLIGSGNMLAMQELVKPHIKDLGQLVRDEAQKELKETVEAVNKKMSR